MLLSANEISKYHNDKCILDHVSFAIEEQDKIALIGVNGTGKSTFLNLVAQQESYQGNRMILKNGLQLSYLPQSSCFLEDDSIINQVRQWTSKNCEDFELKAMLNRFGITDYEQKIKTLSGGQKKRVALAIALLTPCDLLLLDEPTNHLDHLMIEWLQNYLQRYKGAVLMVTHDRYFLDMITNVIWEIEHGKLYEYRGNYSYYLEKKAKREENEVTQEKKRNAFLRKEMEWVKAGVQARSTKSKSRLDRYYELKSLAKRNVQKEVEMVTLTTRLGRKTIELVDVTKRYGERCLFSHFSYHFKQNERVGILGNNGCGKTTLLNIIAHQMSADSGTVIYGETVKIGYFQQDCTELDENMKVIDYIREISDHIVTAEGSFSAKMMLERFLFDSQLQYTYIGRLSGGEKRRLYLLKTLISAPNVLLLDEPTNDLDITTLQILEDYLDHFQGIIIVVSHDRYFLDRICDSMLVFQQGNIISHIGGYSSSFVLEEDRETKEKNGAKEYALSKQKQRENALYMSSKEKKELSIMESEVMRLEQQLQNIDEQMNEERDFKIIDQLAKQREQIHQQLEEKNERWMILLEKEELIKNRKK